MRTSHLAIRRQIAQEKARMTDEEFFASRAFAGYLTDLAEAATGRYRRSVLVRTYWDESPGAGVACTDNRTISVNAGNRITRSFPTRKLRADSLVGLDGHEIGHLLYTDFTMSMAFSEAFLAGRFYPAEPVCDTAGDGEALGELKGYMDAGDRTALRAVLAAARNLENILEDIYIEARMCDAFPGTFRTGILLNSVRLTETVPPLAEQVKNGCLGFSVMCNLILQYCRSGDINDPGGTRGEFFEKLLECVPLLDGAMYENDSRIRYDAANRLILKLWKYVKELIERHREQEKNASSAGEAEQALGSLLAGEIVSGPGIPRGTGKPVRKKYRHDPDALSAARDTVRDVLREEGGRILTEKTDSFSGGDSGGVVRNNAYAGSGYTSAASDMERILGEAAGERVTDRLEDELEAGLKAEADRIGYGNAHRGIRVTVNRMRTLPDGLTASYREVSPPLLLLSARAEALIASMIRDRKEGGKLTGLPAGRRMNARSLVREDGRYFYNTKLPEDETDMAVALLIDESGSMATGDRITYARAAGIVLYDLCRRLEVPVLVYGHTSYGLDAELYAYAEFDSADGLDAYRMMDISARAGNRDGAALRYVAERLMTREEETKLLITISDGQPASMDYYGTAAEADLRGIKREYTNKGITMFSAAIGEDRENIERIYQNGYLDITDLNRLPQNLAKLIAEYIR